jgi:SAM-dependent methyltransferase
VLDIGCSFGRQLKKYYKDGFDVYGIDLNGKAIEDAKKNIPNGHFKNALLEKSSFEDNFFDTIRTSHVLEHVYNIDSFLEEAFRILKPGGKFIIKVPHGNSLEFDIFGRYASQSWIPFHINLFSGETLKRKLSEFGFVKIKYKTKAIPWWWILSWRQMKNRINSEKNKTNFNRSFFTLILMVILYLPLTIVSIFGKGDELIVKSTKK